jgi:hypothetical protein
MIPEQFFDSEGAPATRAGSWPKSKSECSVVVGEGCSTFAASIHYPQTSLTLPSTVLKLTGLRKIDTKSILQSKPGPIRRDVM